MQIIICTSHSDFTWHDIIKRFGHTDRLLMLKKPFEVLEVRQLAYALAEKWNLFNQAKSHLERLQKLVAQRTETLQENQPVSPSRDRPAQKSPGGPAAAERLY